LKELFRDVHRRQQTWHYWPEPNPGTKARCWQAFHQDEKPDHVDPERLFPGGDIRFLAEYWMESNLAVKEFFAEVSPEKCTRVDYDLLVKETDEVIKSCLDFIGLSSSSQKTAPPRIEEQRNVLWRERLNESEMSTLIAFIRDNEPTINIIGDGKDLAGEYLETMDKKQKTGFLRKILFRR
jgi:hypothetical protein